MGPCDNRLLVSPALFMQHFADIDKLLAVSFWSFSIWSEVFISFLLGTCRDNEPLVQAHLNISHRTLHFEDVRFVNRILKVYLWFSKTSNGEGSLGIPLWDHAQAVLVLVLPYDITLLLALLLVEITGRPSEFHSQHDTFVTIAISHWICNCNQLNAAHFSLLSFI